MSPTPRQWDPSVDAPQPPFQNESQLHRYLSKNPEFIEHGLRLFGRTFREGHQFRCGTKRLDILTEDRFGGLLAIEVKYGGVTTYALGQLLGYMAWIKRNPRFFDRFIRGLIVCGKADDYLLQAAEDQGNISVFEWTQEPALNRVLEAETPLQIKSRRFEIPIITDLSRYY